MYLRDFKYLKKDKEYISFLISELMQRKRDLTFRVKEHMTKEEVGLQIFSC